MSDHTLVCFLFVVVVVVVVVADVSGVVAVVVAEASGVGVVEASGAGVEASDDVVPVVVAWSGVVGVGAVLGGTVVVVVLPGAVCPGRVLGVD